MSLDSWNITTTFVILHSVHKWRRTGAWSRFVTFCPWMVHIYRHLCRSKIYSFVVNLSLLKIKLNEIKKSLVLLNSFHNPIFSPFWVFCEVLLVLRRLSLKECIEYYVKDVLNLYLSFRRPTANREMLGNG